MSLEKNTETLATVDTVPDTSISTEIQQHTDVDFNPCQTLHDFWTSVEQEAERQGTSVTLFGSGNFTTALCSETGVGRRNLSHDIGGPIISDATLDNSVCMSFAIEGARPAKHSSYDEIKKSQSKLNPDIDYNLVGTALLTALKPLGKRIRDCRTDLPSWLTREG